ncbi:MAG: hypothetical protein WB711_03125 [Terriglobales bacterium]
MAFAVTALVFALTILHWSHVRSGWLFTTGFGLRGRWLMAVNVFFYGYLCWLGFWFIRGSAGLEHIFLVGWFAGILLSPLGKLRPQWAAGVMQISAAGLTVSLLASLSLLLDLSDIDSSSGTDAT